MFIDVSNSGIGNVVLCVAGFLHSRHGAECTIVSKDTTVFGGLRLPPWARVVTERPSDDDEASLSLFCNIGMLMNPGVVRMMREIVVVPDGVPECRPEVGVCIRTSDPAHDGDVEFLSDRAVETMKAVVREYADRVYVCSNDAKHLRDLPGVYELTNPEERNTTSHWIQWHLLSRCALVMHGIRSGDRLTSTFGPTAAVYGGALIVGVDSETGDLVPPQSYAW